MPFSWPGFTAALSPWFIGEAGRPGLQGSVIGGGKSSYDGSTGSDTAKLIRAEYEIAMMSATTMMFSQPIAPGKGGYSGKLLVKGFEAGFKMQAEAGGTDLGMAPYVVMAAGVLASWAKPVKFLPMPPLPGTIGPNPAMVGAPTTANHTIMPGSPMPLGALIMQAFQCGSASGIAPLLVTAFKTHLMSVAGLYHPMMVAVPSPIPGPPIPWTGIM